MEGILKMTNVRIIAILIAAICGITTVFGQAESRERPAGGQKIEFMSLSEIREGMRGTAFTVFQGNKPEAFGVEILGVVPGAIGPKQDMIVARISGGSADRTGVFAGMSGSPVYVGGKLVGALAYSFPFSKEPIAGITPIEQMVAIFEKREARRGTASEQRSISFSELAALEFSPALPRSAAVTESLLSGMAPDSMLMAVAGQAFRPIATPITFTGISRETLDLFAPQLLRAGLLPVSAAGGAAAITPMKKADENTLRGGDSVSMQLARGDYSLAAAGTVTLRQGDRIYAFGHPFLSLGTSDLPMSESHVVTVVPSINNSFKLAVPDAMVGAMTQDRATGVFGSLGLEPKMIPLSIELETSRGQNETLKLEVARDDFLTPILVNIAVFNAISAQERTVGDAMVELSGEIVVKGKSPVKLNRRFAGGQALQFAAASVALPINTLLRSRFDDLDIGGINLKIRSADGSNTATLERIAIDRTQVKAGETVEIQAFARTNSGRLFTQVIPFTIPADTPAGPVSITVGDGIAIQRNDAIQHFVPLDLNDLINTINKIKLPDRLYARAYRATSGAVIGASEMPNLPPSVLATLNNDRAAGGFKPAAQTVIGEIEIPPAGFLITGEQTLTITVLR